MADDSSGQGLISELLALAREEDSDQTTVRIYKRNKWRAEQVLKEVSNMSISTLVNKALKEMFDRGQVAEPPDDYGYK